MTLIGLWNFFDKIANNFFLLSISIAVVVLVGFALIAIINKNKIASSILAVMALGLTIMGGVIFNNMKELDQTNNQNQQITNSINQHGSNLNQIDQDANTTTQQFQNAVNQQTTIHQNLNNQLHQAQQNAPIEVKTDEEIMDAFAFAASYSFGDASKCCVSRDTSK